MQKNLKVRFTSAIMAILLLMTTAACSGNTTSTESGGSSKVSEDGAATTSQESGGETSEPGDSPTATVEYPMEGDITLTIGDAEHFYATAVCPWEETEFFKQWQEQTGVTLEYQLISDLSLTLASGEYPDILINDIGNSYNGGDDKAIEDGIIIPLDDYIDTYAPDYKAALESNSDWQKMALTPQKHYAGFMHLRVDAPGVSNAFGVIIRQDWLDDLGLEIPETPEEFVEVLRAFRDEKGATVPMSMDSSTLSNVGNSGCFTSAFGLVSTGYYQTDGQLHYGAYESAYKDYLAWLNELYTEGLLDRNFNTLDSQTVGANIMTGMSGVSAGYAGGSLGVWVPTARETTPEYALSGVRSLVAERGDTPMFSQHSDVGGINGYITSSCENVEAAIQFLNYGYTEPGNLLMNFGIEGESFEMKDGKPLYLDSVINSSQGFTQAIAQYAFNPPWGPYIQQADFCTQSYADYQNQALTDWADSDVLDHFVPTLAITENADQYSTIKSEVDTFISENFILFVTGEKSLNEFDSYLDTLKGMGIEDMIAIYQNAYDIYNS